MNLSDILQKCNIIFKTNNEKYQNKKAIEKSMALVIPIHINYFTRVPTGSPFINLSKFPGVFISKTTIGLLFS
jgi:hypothetical protein